MARGILGDDGPSLWIFISVILIWAWIQKTTDKVVKGVKSGFEIGENSAGPLQPETTKDIANLQAFVDAIPITSSRLKYPISHYQSIADDCWTELISPINIDEAKLFGMFQHLTVYELRAVAKKFGLKEPAFLGLTVKTLTIFKAFEWKLSDGVFGNDLSKMRTIWAKSGLWY